MADGSQVVFLEAGADSQERGAFSEKESEGPNGKESHPVHEGLWSSRGWCPGHLRKADDMLFSRELSRTSSLGVYLFPSVCHPYNLWSLDTVQSC